MVNIRVFLCESKRCEKFKLVYPSNHEIDCIVVRVKLGSKEDIMRFNAILAATVTSTALFAVLGTSPVHAETQTSKPATPAAEQQKVEDKVVEVKSGDYLAKIADENKTTYVRIFDANTSIKDPDVIYPGDKVRIPRADEQLVSRIAAVAPAPQPVASAQPRQRVQTRAAAPRPTPVRTVGVVSGDVWDRLAQCESGGNWAINTGNGYYGGLQFTLSSWRGVGGSGYPNQASREEQIARGKMLQARQGWGAWPACTLKLGIR